MLKVGTNICAILPILSAMACSSDVSGQVIDAASGEPVPGAMVEVASTGWGIRDSQLVWDKEVVRNVHADASGRFRIGGGGGHRLTVRASGYSAVDTSLCSSSPMLVRIGGTTRGVDLTQMMRIPDASSQTTVGWSFAGRGTESPVADADLILRLNGHEDGSANFEAPRGAAFVPGTGNPAPVPRSGYGPSVGLNLLDCGWLYVRTRSGAVVIVRIGSFGTETRPAGSRVVALNYGKA